MIANVRFKIEMRTRALFGTLLDLVGQPDAWQRYHAELAIPCGHREDWRCRLAAIVSQEHPGCVVHVGQFTVELDLPVRYKGSERTLRIQMPPRVRSLMVALSTPEGMQERKFLSCPTTQMPAEYLRGISTHRRGR